MSISVKVNSNVDGMFDSKDNVSINHLKKAAGPLGAIPGDGLQRQNYAPLLRSSFTRPSPQSTTLFKRALSCVPSGTFCAHHKYTPLQNLTDRSAVTVLKGRMPPFFPLRDRTTLTRRDYHIVGSPQIVRSGNSSQIAVNMTVQL